VIRLPPEVVRNARALGGEAALWLEVLPELVEGLCREWGLTLGGTLHGGNSSYVAEAVRTDGTLAVFKIAMAGFEPIDCEVKTLTLADGKGYVRLLEADVARLAMVTERLGAPLGKAGLSPEDQVDALCATVVSAWRPAPPDLGLQTTAEKGAWLDGFIREAWEAYGRPCGEDLIAMVVENIRRRVAAFDPAQAMLLHGDPHGGNALADPKSPGAYRLVDPDGLAGDPAYDLAIVLRDALEGLDPDPGPLARARCRRLSARTGLPETAIWEWAVTEMVSSGLYLIRLNAEREGRRYLDMARAWAFSPA